MLENFHCNYQEPSRGILVRVRDRDRDEKISIHTATPVTSLDNQTQSFR
jgi:hypothetical protein